MPIQFVHNLKQKLSSLFTRIYIKQKEREFRDQLPYLYQRCGSDSLLIVFSAFTGEKRRYNYVKSLWPLRCDKLFILDPWGELGSYNLFENGQDYPQVLTLQLIDLIIQGGHYKFVYTAGTSKGGTCAIYFGLSIGANEVFSGACQYNLGTYLWREEFRNVFYGMMGKGSGQKEVDLLNSILKEKVRAARKGSSRIHVFYSKKELTYERQIVDLLHDLKENEVPFVEVESDFEKHELVAGPFANYINSYLSKKLDNEEEF